MAADVRALSWKCHACNMVFTNPSLLQKHRGRFCVGKWDPELMGVSTTRREEKTQKPPPPETSSPRYNPHNDPKVKQLAEVHGRQMEYLSNRNRELERQRDEIRRRLEDLGRRPPEKDNSTDELLRELREQEARNQRLLNELRMQLADARRPVNVVQQAAAPEPATKKTFIYPVYYGNSLVAEIIAVRQAYLQNGGSDPEILAQLSQMQAEAQAIDDSMKNAQKKQPRDRKGDDSVQLMTLEMENERLQRQLQLLQDQKIISTNRRKDNREGRMPLPPDSGLDSPIKSPTPHQSPQRKVASTQYPTPQEPPTTHPSPSNEPPNTQRSANHDPPTTQQSPNNERPITQQSSNREPPDTQQSPSHQPPPSQQPSPQKSQRNDVSGPNEANGTEESPHQNSPDRSPSYKRTPRSVSKWVQTNPVPFHQADTSALAGDNYPAKRHNAKLALEDHWGPDNVLPTPSMGPQPLKRRSIMQKPPVSKRGSGREEPPQTLETLQPERLDTIAEASHVDFYNPDQPLDVNLSPLTHRKKKKRFFPFKPELGPRVNSARLVVVQSEKPYGWVDFYGRAVDENGRLLKTFQQERYRQQLREDLSQYRQGMKRNMYPYYTRSLTDPRDLAYQLWLDDGYGRPGDLRLYPFHSDLYARSKFYTAEPLDIDRRALKGRRQTTHPLTIQEIQDDPQEAAPPPPETANAEAQTTPLSRSQRAEDPKPYPQPRRRQPASEVGQNPEDEDPQSDRRNGIRRPPPPTQRPPDLGSQTGQPENSTAANPPPSETGGQERTTDRRRK